MSPSPWAFHAHFGAWAAVVVIGGLYLFLALRPGAFGRRVPPSPPSRRQWWQFGWAMVALAAALTWPVADLAAHWSLTALLAQRLLLTLVVAPLLLLAVPTPVLGRLSRPWPVDVVVDFLSRPQAAI